jgi:hypothetical protein
VSSERTRAPRDLGRRWSSAVTEPRCGVADGGSTAPRSLDELAREWARAIATTGAVPTSPSDAGRYLSDLLRRLEAALSGPVVDTDVAFDVGGRLVAGHFTGSRSLSRTVEVLGRGLPTALESTLAGWSGNRVVALLAALVAGYVAALRQHLCDQQKSVEETPLSPLVNSAVLGIVISEPDGRITQTNPTLRKILGYSEDKLLGHELSELFFSEDLPAFQRGCQHLLSGDKPWLRRRGDRPRFGGMGRGCSWCVRRGIGEVSPSVRSQRDLRRPAVGAGSSQDEAGLSPRRRVERDR